MKKESIIAITFGILLGGVVALLVISKNKENQMKTAKTLGPKLTVTPAAMTSGIVQTLEITSPSDRMIVNATSINIKGKADKGSLIVVQSAIKEVAVKNDKGNFSIDFPLATGENIINIVAYPKDPKSRSQEKKLKIYNLPES